MIEKLLVRGFIPELAIHRCVQRCRSLLSIGGDNLQFYPNFALFSTLGVMNLDHDFVQVWKFSEDQKKMQMEQFFPHIQVKTKKKVFFKNRTPFFPIFAQMHTPSNYWRGYSQIIGGDISPIPPLFRHPWLCPWKRHFTHVPHQGQAGNPLCLICNLAPQKGCFLPSVRIDKRRLLGSYS